jgi:nucleoside-diphosphate-sugar epimerase
MKICITGSSGYIATHLKKALKTVDVVLLDIKDGNDILTCELPDVDVVIHLAAQPGVIKSFEDPFETIRTNTLGTVRLAEKYKDTKFIFASTGGAIQDEIPSPYGVSKYASELLIKILFNNYVILRFANVYGKEGSRSVIDKFLKEDEITIYGDGSQTRTFVYIDDLIDGIIKSINWPKGEYYFGSEENYTIKELAEVTCKPIKYEDWRKGELIHSSLKNTTPNWNPTVNIKDYIKTYVSNKT